MRRAARTDANQIAIVAALRAVGARVAVISGCGNGIPDLLVLHPRTWEVLLVEVKNGAKSASRRRLTPAEAEFAEVWPVNVVNSVVEALALVGVCLP